MQNKIQILSTRKINNSLISVAGKNHICIDEMNFIETEEILSAEIKKRITELSTQKVAVIFTSSKAVNAVGKFIRGKVFWKIFCIEPATKKSVENCFENVQIVGTATNADELADKIIQDNSVKKIVFFCGGQRRNVLPEKLKRNEINVEELVVYETIEKPKFVSKNYDAILFFSPSAVRSFFSSNKIKEETILFAIGKTTAEEVKLSTNAKTIIAEMPDQEKLIGEVIKYFSSIKTL